MATLWASVAGRRVYRSILTLCAIFTGNCLLLLLLTLSFGNTVKASGDVPFVPGVREGPTWDQRQTLRVATQASFWPFAYYSGTQLVGYDIELMDALAGHMGVDVEYVDVPWEEIFDGVVDGQHDAIISAITVTPDREETVDFTLPYMHESHGGIGIAVRQGDSELRRLLNEGLMHLRSTGVLTSIVQKANTDLKTVTETAGITVTMPHWPSIPSGSSVTLLFTGTHDFRTEIEVPAGTVPGSTVFSFNVVDNPPLPSGFAIAGRVFEIDVFSNGIHLTEGMTVSPPVTVTIFYSDSGVSVSNELALRLMRYDESEGIWRGAGCGAYQRDPEQNVLSVPVCHLSMFALFRVSEIYLPSILR